MTTQSNECLLALTDAFHAAALGDGSWDAALQGLADATGSRSAQLAVMHSDASVAFSTITNVDPAVLKFFPETTTINPRVPFARLVPILRATVDWDIMTPEAYRRDRYCQEFLRPYDIPFVCWSTLDRSEQMYVILAAVRSHREGTITDQQKQIFEATALHVRAAVRTHAVLAGRGLAMLTEAMQTLSVPAFVCDQAGRVLNLTPAAEALLRGDCGLKLEASGLDASEPDDRRALHDAMVAAAACQDKRSPPFCRTVVIRGDGSAVPVVLDVLTMPPRPYALHFANPQPRVLVIARSSRSAGASRAAILAAAYGLTPAECEVALQLADGKTTAAIAMSRGVAVGTVRAQIKTILGKVGVRKQIELSARLKQL
jgi:DNA-binding CsgD family transcriptional regulator